MSPNVLQLVDCGELYAIPLKLLLKITRITHAEI